MKDRLCFVLRLLCLVSLLLNGGSLSATTQVPFGFVYKEKEYTVDKCLLWMDEVGLRPEARSSANWAAQIPTYGIDGNKLVLKDLITNNGRGEEPPPEINGVAPQRMEPAMCNLGHDLEYKNVNLPIHYTGTFVIKADFIRERYRFGEWSYSRLSNYESVIELTFENGILTSEKDMSKEMEERRRVGAILEPIRKNGNVEIIKSLISKGEDVNMKDEIGQTLLHMAAEQGNIRLTAFLIPKGADVHSKDDYARTPIYGAKNVEVARILVSQGANVQAKDDWGDTPLHTAVYHDIAVVAFLVSEGADIHAKNDRGQTPLHKAVEWNENIDIEILDFLVSKGADVNAKDDVGNTPLHYAAACQNSNAIKFLGSKGADVKAKNNEDETPLDRTKRYEDWEDLVWKPGVKEYLSGVGSVDAIKYDSTTRFDTTKRTEKRVVFGNDRMPLRFRIMDRMRAMR